MQERKTREEGPPRRPPPEEEDWCGEPTIPTLSSHERNRKPRYEEDHKKHLLEHIVSGIFVSLFIYMYMYIVYTIMYMYVYVLLRFTGAQTGGGRDAAGATPGDRFDTTTATHARR